MGYLGVWDLEERKQADHLLKRGGSLLAKRLKGR